MLLTKEELRSLVGLTHQSPHSLLGMQPLGDGSGLVVRALLPGTAKVEIQPVHEKDKPKFELKRIPNTDVFEGLTKAATKVYAYDLVITDHQGQTRRTRDAFSFLPTLGESDLFLFGKGDERKIFDKLGAQLRSPDGVPGTSFAVWAPNAQRISVVGDFNHWDGRFHSLRLLGRRQLRPAGLVHIKHEDVLHRWISFAGRGRASCSADTMTRGGPAFGQRPAGIW